MAKVQVTVAPAATVKLVVDPSPQFEPVSAQPAAAVSLTVYVPGRKAPIEVDTDLIMRNLVLENQIVLAGLARRKSPEAHERGCAADRRRVDR